MGLSVVSIIFLLAFAALKRRARKRRKKDEQQERALKELSVSGRHNASYAELPALNSSEADNASSTSAGGSGMGRAYTALLLMPEILLLVVLATLLSHWYGLESLGVAVLGPLESGFTTPAVPSLKSKDLSQMFTSALTIVLLGFVETQIANKIYAAKHDYTVSPNRSRT